mmetsp:Transcript_9566/g.58264  ORF Transcript_9566/g.58264 Transcript_9566/m.58264 type:complete len:259 (+) Transcript_9566:163-939(+)
MAARPSSGLGASPNVLTSALPTITPSAPHDTTFFTCSGVEIPNPTATGLFEASLIVFTNVPTLSAMLTLAPVTPVTDTRYMKPSVSSAIFFILSNGVTGVARRTICRPAAVASGRISCVSSMGRSGTSKPFAPASTALLQKFSQPIAMIGLKYVNMTMGALMCGETSASMLRTDSMGHPFDSARVAAACIVGPSASGSEYGTPSSITVAPARSSILMASLVVSKSGSPAHKKGTNATFPSALHRSKASETDAGASLIC